MMGGTIGDKRVWENVLALKLEGVAEHAHMAQLAELEGLPGFSTIQRYHSIDEYKEYLCLAEEYVRDYSSIPIVKMEQKEMPGRLDAQTLDGKVEALLDMYDDWEEGMLSRLRSCRKQLTNCKSGISDQICGVRKELDFVDKLREHLEKVAGDEVELRKLDAWLQETYKKKIV